MATPDATYLILFSANLALTLTVVSFKMEQGYIGSGLRMFQDQLLFEEDYNSSYNQNAQENWHQVNSFDNW